jgi:hypothetical protein
MLGAKEISAKSFRDGWSGVEALVVETQEAKDIPLAFSGGRCLHQQMGKRLLPLCGDGLALFYEAFCGIMNQNE